MSFKYPVGHDEYRDDRKFVMNLEPCGGDEWLLTTYRNTGSLPPVRQDKFESKEAAFKYVKKWEVTVPILSLREKPLDLNPDGSKSGEDVHAEYEVWLGKRGLFSALSLKRHVPYFSDSRGWTEKRRIARYETRTEKIDELEVEVSESGDSLRVL